MADFAPLFGYQPDRDGTDAFLATLARPTLAQAGPDLLLDESRDVFLGSYLLACDPGWTRGGQKIGSCVGWGWSLSCDILAACDIAIRNEAETYGGRVLEASVYAFSRVEVRGGRNLGGDGSYGGAAAKAVTQYGTLHYGIDYGGGDTFTDNSGSREKEWGRDGVPDRLEKFAAQHKVSAVALTKDFESAAKAIQNGYPVAVCSMRGFSMTLRDGGYLTPSGQWAHCMMFAGIRWKPRPALLCVNSWNDCYSGDVDKTLPVQFQRSAGWVEASVCTSMLAGEDSFALSGYAGFPPRTLPDWTGGAL
jgi:hypothetical protein